MGAPDSALPVFSFRPDWAQGITEHLEWLTDVLTSKTAAEQRNSLRLSARRSFEAQIAPLKNERTFLDLFIRRFSNQEFMVPLWHDRTTLGSGVAIGATSLTVDTTDREFVAGGMALLVGADPFSCEAVQVSAVASGALTLSVPTGLAWAAGTVIHPLRRTWLLEQPTASHQTGTLDTVPMQFLLSGPQDYDGGAEELATYAGYPILSPAPDWSDVLSLEYARPLAEVDGKVGLRAFGDPASRSFAIQMHRWFLEGRAEQAAFRRLIARLRGKQGALWLPSFTADLTIAAPVTAGDTHIDVQPCGLVYTGLQAGRQHAIGTSGEMLQFTAVSAVGGIERLTLSAPISGTLAIGDTLSFADIGRLDADTIDIHHQTDSDGVAQVELPCRSFPDIRDGSAVGALALPTATMGTDACGCAPGTVDDCSTVTPISTGNMTITLVGPTLPDWPNPSDGGDGHYLIVDLVIGLKDFFGNPYILPVINLVGTHADGTQFDYADPPQATITDHCGNVCNIGVTHTRSGSTVTIQAIIDSEYFRFTDPRQAQPTGVSDADYARNGTSYDMIALSVGGTIEEGWIGSASVSTSVVLGGASGLPRYESTQNGTIGGTVGTVPSGPHAGETYNYLYYACSAFLLGATP